MVTCAVYTILLILCLRGADSDDASFASRGSDNNGNNEKLKGAEFKNEPLSTIKNQASSDAVLSHEQTVDLERDGVTLPRGVLEDRSQVSSGRDGFPERTATRDAPHSTGAAPARHTPFEKWTFGESERSGANINGLAARHQSKRRRFDTDGSAPIVTDTGGARWGEAGGENGSGPKRDFHKSRKDELRNERATLFDGSSRAVRTEIDNGVQWGEVLKDEDPGSAQGQGYSAAAFSGGRINDPRLGGDDGDSNSLTRSRVGARVTEQLATDNGESADLPGKRNSEEDVYQDSTSERDAARKQGRHVEMESANRIAPDDETNGAGSGNPVTVKTHPFRGRDGDLESHRSVSRGGGGHKGGGPTEESQGREDGRETERVRNGNAERGARFRYDWIDTEINGSVGGTGRDDRVSETLKKDERLRTFSTSSGHAPRQDERNARARSLVEIRKTGVNNEKDRRGEVMRSDGQARGLKSNPALGGDRGVKRTGNRRRGVKLKAEHVPKEITHGGGTFGVAESPVETVWDEGPERYALIWRKRRILGVHSGEYVKDYAGEIAGDRTVVGEEKREGVDTEPHVGVLRNDAIETHLTAEHDGVDRYAVGLTQTSAQHFTAATTSEALSDESMVDRGTRVSDGDRVSWVENAGEDDAGSDRRTNGEKMDRPGRRGSKHSVDGVNTAPSEVEPEGARDVSEVDLLKMGDVGYADRDNAGLKVAGGDGGSPSPDQIAISAGGHHGRITEDNVIGGRPGAGTTLWERDGGQRNGRSADTAPERGNDEGVRGDKVRTDNVGVGWGRGDAHDLDIKKLSELVNGGRGHSTRVESDPGRGPVGSKSDGKYETMKFVSEHNVSDVDSGVFDDVVSWISSLVSEKSKTDAREGAGDRDAGIPEGSSRNKQRADDFHEESSLQDGLYSRSTPVGSTFGYRSLSANENEDDDGPYGTDEPYGTVTSAYNAFRGLRDVDESDESNAQGFSSYEELFHTDNIPLNAVTTEDAATDYPQGYDTTESGSWYKEKESISSTSGPLDDAGVFDYFYNVDDAEEYKDEGASFLSSMRGFDYENEAPHHRSKHSVSDAPYVSLTTPEQRKSPKAWEPSQTTPRVATAGGAVSFESLRLVLTRVNEPNLDATYIQYVPEAEVELALANPKPSWANDVLDPNGNPIVKIGVILPGRASILFSLNKSRSSIELASEKIIGPGGSLPGYKVQIVFRDSRCSETFGPLNGIDLYVRRLAYVFIGPSCDFATAPLARFTYYWGKGIPIMTAGSLVGAFADKQEYRLLTRIQGGYTMTAEFVRRVVETFEWSTFGFVFHDVKFGSKTSQSECLRLMDRVYTVLQRRYKRAQWFLNFNENEMNETMYEMLLENVRVNTRNIWKMPPSAGVVISLDTLTAPTSDAPRRVGEQMSASHTKTAEFFHSIFDAHGWSTFGLIFHDGAVNNRNKSDCSFLIDEIFIRLNEIYHKSPWFLRFNEKVSPGAYFEEVLKKAENNTRIVVMCASPQTVREIMIKAHELNFDNGEYVFFNIDLFSSKNASETPWYRPDDTEERNSKARKAYESLMTVTLRMPTSTEYRHFSNEVKARALEMFPNFTYGEDEVNSFVGAFHDAVLLYALALNETLAENGSISDGDTITKKMWNRTFAGITGNVSIDANGDRNADYSLLDLNPETNKFEVVANYFGNKRKYEPVPNKTIHWAGGRLGPPPDTPTCGFDGSKCPPDEPFPEYGIVIIVLGSILLIVLIAVFFIYRHIKLEAELAEMNWRVRWDDILFGAPEKNKKLERQGSRLSLRKGSLPSDCSGDTIAVHLNDASNRQLFTRTGYYKGAIIAIKPIHRSNITINKPMLLEIKRMKDLQNDHIVRFIGACICFPNSCILTEYCPKGSLQDVLENEQIKLDWMFRYSIMQDIVRGMAYLQGTEIRSHGYLKSTNCVVDSRFVVKITDFGLHHLRGAVRSSEEDENSYSYFHNKLWTAPELLRMAYRPPEGTIKGDVYSFAIICQEIVYRNGVFYLQNMDVSPQEISQKVKLGLKPYFRPTLEEYDCPCDELAGVIKRCWAEDPADRPDFQALKSIIRKLNRDGDKGNILDNLLSRMEQYANNLEALVEERTADYLQQKKKAEDLLYNMLPKKVASQLIRGESVTAEWYDSVSIYFSDICGFTAMSAESTPMEVVDLLNDLYTTFDSIIENFDVYKVETIGDAYMVVSGLPDRNGILHAREIARMSLALLKATVTFRIRHRPKDRLKIRIGIHTGSVCAGVVGLKMPRYCLFGDTVNTASRMESNGLPLKIHVSPQCKEVLDTFGSFDLELRGNVEMKGKGSVKTYWLQGEKTTSDSPGVSLNIL